MSFLIRRGITSSGGLGGVFDANTSLLDGVDQYYDVTSSAILNVDTDDFDIIVRVRVPTDSDNVSKSIINKSEFFGFENGYRISVSSGQIQWEVSGSAGRSRVTGTTDIRTGNWTIVRCTRDSVNGHRIFINGVEETYSFSQNASVIRDVNNSVRFAIGYGEGAGLFGDYWYGSIGPFLYLKGGMTAPEIAEVTDTNPKCFSTLSSGLQTKLNASGGYWELANWTGHTGVEPDDQTDNGSDLTSINSPTYTDTGLTVDCS